MSIQLTDTLASANQSAAAAAAASTAAHAADPLAHSIAQFGGARTLSWLKSGITLTGTASGYGHNYSNSGATTGATANSTAIRACYASVFDGLQDCAVFDLVSTGHTLELEWGAAIIELAGATGLFRVGFGKDENDAAGMTRAGFGFEIRGRDVWVWFKATDAAAPTYADCAATLATDRFIYRLGIRITPGATDDLIEFFVCGLRKAALTVARTSFGISKCPFYEISNGATSAAHNVIVSSTLIR